MKKKVLILLSTFNGGGYLKEQIESLRKQTGVSVSLLVRDDGSTDDTLNILKQYQKKFENYRIIEGQNIGPGKSFFQLLKEAYLIKQKYDYFAFCDQDDVWLKDKLLASVEALRKFDNEPTLYFSNYTIVDNELKLLSESKTNLYLTLGESFIRNPSLGCTQVFNRPLLELLNIYFPNYSFMHDAWIYRVCLAVGGRLVFDTNSYIYYRQHDNNVVGGKSNFTLKWKRRIKTYIIKQANIRLNMAKEIMNGYGNIITDKNNEILKSIVDYKHSLLKRYKLLKRDDIKSASREHNFIFKIAVLIGVY